VDVGLVKRPGPVMVKSEPVKAPWAEWCKGL
jgi:hypothetical protein